MANQTAAQKRKRTMKKAMKKQGGLLGRAGRRLMGRAQQIEAGVSGNPPPKKKKRAAPKKKKTMRKRY